MRVVITGGAGFIGANLAREMIARGDDVVVIDDLSTGRAGNLAELRLDFHEATILDPAALDKALAGAEAIVHLAALPSVPRSVADPMASHQANATGTLEVLMAARRAETPYVVLASSSSVYGANPELPKRETMTVAPMSPYAVSKLAAESYALAFMHCYEMAALAFRFFNVYGPLQPAGHAYAAVIPAFVDAAVRGQPVPMQGDGSQSRDFTYVGTVTRILADAAHRRVTHDRPVNLAFGGRTTLRELVSLIEEEIGHRVEIQSLPPRTGDVPHSQADASTLLRLFPDVVPVSTDEGLRHTIQWFMSDGQR